MASRGKEWRQRRRRGRESGRRSGWRSGRRLGLPHGDEPAAPAEVALEAQGEVPTAGSVPLMAARPPLSAAGFIAQLRGGAVADSARAELIAGAVKLAPRPSAAAAAALAALEARLRAEVGHVRQPGRPQLLAMPLLRLGPYVLLRPALALAVESQHPGTTPLLGESTGVEGLLLVVEVQHDRSIAHERLANYAAASVRETWLLDLSAGYTEAYRSPWAGRYRSRTLWYPGEAVPVSTVPGLVVVALTGSR